MFDIRAECSDVKNNKWRLGLAQDALLLKPYGKWTSKGYITKNNVLATQPV